MGQVRRKFQFLRLVASGGFGDVYLCKEIQESGIGRLVAVKLLKSHWRDSQEVVARLRDEARLLALLRHKNIITVYSLTAIQGRTAVVMEYLDAVDLSEIIEQMSPKQRIPLRVTFAVIADVAQALDAAYNQTAFAGNKPLRVIHRDIKPSNIMIDATGLVKVLDFGVARSDFSGRESQTRELQFGSVEYMAPERLFFEPETPASDIYSLTLTLYECLSTQPFGKVSPKREIHEQRLQEKLDVLLQSLSALPIIIKKEIHSILKQGLSHDAKMRLSAAELATRCRNLERQISGRTLADWSERAIPLLQKKRGEMEEGSLQGRILDEDSTALMKNEAKTPQQGNEHTLRMGILAELRQSIEQMEPSGLSEHDEMFFEEATAFHERPSSDLEKNQDRDQVLPDLTKNSEITQPDGLFLDNASTLAMSNSNKKQLKMPAKLDDKENESTVPPFHDDLEEIKTSLMSRMTSKKPFTLAEKDLLKKESLSEDIPEQVLSAVQESQNTLNIQKEDTSNMTFPPSSPMSFVPDFPTPEKNQIGVINDESENQNEEPGTLMMSRKQVKAIGNSYQHQVQDDHNAELRTIKMLFGAGLGVLLLCIIILIVLLLRPEMLEPNASSDEGEFELSEFDIDVSTTKEKVNSVETLISQVKLHSDVQNGILIVSPNASSLTIECKGEEKNSKRTNKKKEEKVADTTYFNFLRKDEARVHFIEKSRITKCEIMQENTSRTTTTVVLTEMTIGRYNCFENDASVCNKE